MHYNTCSAKPNKQNSRVAHSKKKIVFFDTWLSAMRLTDLLAKELCKDYNLIFLSINNLHDKYIEKELRLQNLNLYKERAHNNVFYHKICDLSEYNNSMQSFFEKEKPDLACVISLHNLDHRWFNIACQYYKTPAFLIMHGVKGEAVFRKAPKKPKNLFYTIKRFVFYNVLFLYYLREKKSLKMLNGFSDLIEWHQLIFQHHRFKFIPKYSYNVKYDTLFITTQSDISYFKKYYKSLESARFHVFGTFDLIGFFEKLTQLKKVEKQATFIGQGLKGTMNAREYIKAVKTLNDYCVEKGVKFVYRAHPRESQEMAVTLKKQGIIVSENSLYDDIYNSILMFGFYSTLLLTGLSLNITVVSFPIKAVPHPSFFYDYSNSYVFNSLNDFLNGFDFTEATKHTPTATAEKSPIKLFQEEVQRFLI